MTFFPILPRPHSSHNENFFYTSTRHLVHDILDQNVSLVDMMVEQSGTIHCYTQADLANHLATLVSPVLKTPRSSIRLRCSQ
jgi:hypothetical protein